MTKTLLPRSGKKKNDWVIFILVMMQLPDNNRGFERVFGSKTNPDRGTLQIKQVIFYRDPVDVASTRFRPRPVSSTPPPPTARARRHSGVIALLAGGTLIKQKATAESSPGTRPQAVASDGPSGRSRLIDVRGVLKPVIFIPPPPLTLFLLFSQIQANVDLMQVNTFEVLEC